MPFIFFSKVSQTLDRALRACSKSEDGSEPGHSDKQLTECFSAPTTRAGAPLLSMGGWIRMLSCPRLQDLLLQTECFVCTLPPPPAFPPKDPRTREQDDTDSLSLLACALHNRGAPLSSCERGLWAQG